MSARKGKLTAGAVDRRGVPGVRRSTGTGAGLLALVVAIGLTVVACSPGTRDGQGAAPSAAQPPTAFPADPKAEEVATAFVEAFGAFDGERAITYLAESPYLEMNATTPEEVPRFTSFLEAMGYRQILVDPCRITGSSATGTSVRCPFDWHAIRSDEIGLGPYPGRWDLTVRDGEIVSASLNWSIEKFGAQMWVPFRDWVSQSYPKDFDVMYVEGGSDFSFTEDSARLWERHSQEYVEVVGSQ